MTRQVSGNVGLRFNVREVDDSADTGQFNILHSIEDTIGDILLADTDEIISYAGQVGTTGTTFTLSALDNFNDGTYTMKIQNETSPVAAATIKAIFFHNKAAAGTISLDNGANAFLVASDQITADAGSGAGYVWPEGRTVTATTADQIKFTGSINNLDLEVYLVVTI